MKEEFEKITTDLYELRQMAYCEGKYNTRPYNLYKRINKYLEDLQSQLKAKEEVIETIKKQLYNAINILKDVDDETNKTIMGCMTGTLSQIIELEEILSKGESK